MAVTKRCGTLVRTWKLLVMLRGGPHRLESLARELGVTTRTIRRDLAALEEAGLPVDLSPAGRWFVRETAEWPRQATAPTQALRA